MGRLRRKQLSIPGLPRLTDRISKKQRTHLMIVATVNGWTDEQRHQLIAKIQGTPKRRSHSVDVKGVYYQEILFHLKNPPWGDTRRKRRTRKTKIVQPLLWDDDACRL
jgi:hypothetical protein